MKFSTAIIAASVAASSVYATPFAARAAAPANSTMPAAVPSAPPAPQLLGNANAKPNVAVPSGLVGQLRNADTAAARISQFADQVKAGKASLVFDLNPAANPGVRPGLGGQVDLAAANNYPLLVGQNVATAGVFLSACGLNPLHTHPRATEILTVVTDSRISTGFIFDNTFNTPQLANLTQYQATAFPIGSTHWVQNMDCKPAVAIASFGSEDPGTATTANIIGQAPQDITQASFGIPEQIDAKNFQAFKDKIPRPLALGIQECLTRCNIKA